MKKAATSAYEHLREQSAAIARSDDHTRLEYLRADHWIGYPRAKAAIARLNELYAWPPRVRPRNMLLVGATNQGKSMIIESFMRQHKGQSQVDQESIPVVKVLMPDGPTVARFFEAILKSVGAPYRKNARRSELESIAMEVMSSSGTRLIIIDEVHNMLAGNVSTRHDFLTVLRSLGNELRIPLVCAGTRDAYLAIRSDPQLENRFLPFVLPRWSVNDEYLAILASFARMLPLRRPSQLTSGAMADYLLARSEGILGELSDLLCSAAAAAILSGEERINESSLSEAAYQGPTIRRLELEGMMI